MPLTHRANQKKIDEREALETAWRLHASVQDWVGKVDAKASFAFGLEVAVITAVLALTTKGDASLDSWHEVTLFIVGVVLIGLAIVMASLAVVPRIRMRRHLEAKSHDFVYFGQLKNWHPDDLQEALLERSPLEGLSKQLVVISRIAWRKHRLVQASLALSIVGGTALVACFALVNIGK